MPLKDAAARLRYNRAYHLARYVPARRAIYAHKAANPCIDCGERNPVVLELDHRDPTKKLFALGKLPSSPIGVVLAELAKCDVRCANCHRIKTFRDRGWGIYDAL